jgi:hypothetical protein
MASVTRKHKFTVYLDDDEYALLYARTELSGMKTCSEYARYIMKTGMIYYVDFSDIHENNRLLSNLTNNLNQIAHQANSCGYVTKNDIKEVKKIMEDVWQLQKSMQSRLLFKNP